MNNQNFYTSLVLITRNKIRMCTQEQVLRIGELKRNRVLSTLYMAFYVIYSCSYGFSRETENWNIYSRV